MSQTANYKTAWSWQSKDNDIITCRLWFDGRVPLDELVAQIREFAPEAADVTFGGGMVMWSRAATESELASRHAWQQQQAERHAEWKRKMHAQLNEEFGTAKRLAELDRLRVAVEEMRDRAQEVRQGVADLDMLSATGAADYILTGE